MVSDHARDCAQWSKVQQRGQQINGFYTAPQASFGSMHYKKRGWNDEWRRRTASAADLDQYVRCRTHVRLITWLRKQGTVPCWCFTTRSPRDAIKTTLFELVFSLSGNITYTNRPQGVNCRGYLHVLKYLLFISRLLYLRRMEWCRRISLQTSSCDTFMKLSRFDVCKSTLLHHSFLLKYRVGQKTGLFLRWELCND